MVVDNVAICDKVAMNKHFKIMQTTEGGRRVLSLNIRKKQKLINH